METCPPPPNNQKAIVLMVILTMTVPSNNGTFGGYTDKLNLRSWSTTSSLGESHTSELTEKISALSARNNYILPYRPSEFRSIVKGETPEIKNVLLTDLRELLI